MRWGVLGTGMIAGKVLPCINAADGCRVTCVASRDAARAAAFAGAHALPASAACDERQLLSRADVDAVYVTVPNHLHTECSVRLLEAGKHVICEKPLACREADARRVADAAARSGRLFAEGFMYLHHPQTDLLVRAGRAGTSPSPDNLIGPLQTIVASFCLDLRHRPNAWTRFSRTLEGGAVMDLGCYPLSLARSITGEEPARIAATARTGPPITGELRGVDALTSFSGVFPSGVVLHALCAIDSDAGVHASLVGAWGRLETDTPFRADPVRAELRWTRFDTHPRGPGAETIVIQDGGDRFVNQFSRFSAAARDGRATNPTPDWSVGQAAAIERLHGLIGWPG